MIKQVLVVRKDLKMRKGKIAAQCCHASNMILLNQKIATPLADEIFSFSMTPAMQSWLAGSFTKVVVSVDSEDELEAIYAKALEAGVLTALCVDSGKTEFHGIPTKTVVAVGPEESEKIDQITGGLKLL